MKITVNHKPLPTAEREKHREAKRLKKQFGGHDLKAIFKYIEGLEKRIEILEKAKIGQPK